MGALDCPNLPTVGSYIPTHHLSEIDKFCLDHGLDPSLETDVPGERIVNQCPKGFLNGDWHTIEKTQCEAAFLFTIVGHTYAWRTSSFSFPTEMEVHELEQGLLLKLHASRTKIRAYLEELLMVLEMSALDYILLDDPSGVEIEQREIPEGGPSIVRRTEHVRTTPLQPIMDGSSAKKLLALFEGLPGELFLPDDANVVASVTRIKLMKKEVVPEASGRTGDASSLKISVVLKKLNETKKNVPGRSTHALEVGSSEATASKPISKEKPKGDLLSLLPWGKGLHKVKEKVEKVKEEVESPVCHEMLKYMATPAEKDALSKLSDEDAAYRVITQVARLITSILDSIERWATSVNRNDELAASLKGKEADLQTSQEDLAAFQVKVNELEGIYTKAMAHGRHTGLIVGVDAASRGEAIEKLPAFKPDSLPDFVSVVKKRGVLSYPYVEALSQMVDRPVAELGALELEGLNKEFDEEGGDVGPSTKKLKVTEDPKPVSSKSIPLMLPRCLL
ncbi:hypothetical protein Hanom_Chr17g01572421 [Helianthus anomalus]